MEHPYLKPLPHRKFNSAVGESGRAARQHAHVVAAVQAIDALIFSCLPELVSEPMGELGTDEFEERIRQIDNALQATGLPRRAMIVAWNRLCRFIDQGNADGLWVLPAVIPYEQLPSQSLLRTRRWQRHATLVHTIHQRLVGAIATGDPTLLDERPVALALALFFGAVHSGLCEASIMDAFARAIMAKEKLLPRPDAPRVWIALKLDEPALTNTYHLFNDEAERVMIARRELDPLTISLVRRCWDGRGDYLEEDFDRNTLVQWINSGLKRLDPDMPSIPSLKRFGRAALSINEKHTALPHVYMEVACGRIPTCDLPDSAWNRLCGYQFVDPLKERPELQNELDGLEPPVVSSQKVSRATRDAIYTEIQTVISTALEIPDTAGGRQYAINGLRALDTAQYPLAARLLVTWGLEHLEIRGNTVSTVSRYLYEVGPGLIEAMSGADVYDADDLGDVYRSIIDAKRDDTQKHYTAGRLQDLHDVARAHFGFPALHESLTADHKVIRHVRASFIPEHVYVSALREIANLPNRNKHYKRALKVIVILAYRTGMRRNEILHLQLGDIEDSEERIIFVRANSLGPLKSSSARRNIPAGSLLRRSELQILDAFYRERQAGRPSRTELLFCIEGSRRQPLDSHQVSNDVKRILWAAGFDGVLHDCRHTALSRLQLVAEREWVLVERFSAYSRAEGERIYQAVFGHPKSAHRRYWALAAFAGHSSPGITFASYLHFSSILLYEVLHRSTLTYGREFLSAVTGLGQTKLGKIAKSANCDRDALPLKILHGAVTTKHSKIFQRLGKLDTKPTIDVEPNALETPGPSPFVLHKALQGYERGYSIESVAYEFGLIPEYLRQRIGPARILAAEKTRRGRNRLISRTRAERRRPVITPAVPTNRFLVIDSAALFGNLRKVYRIKQEEIEWAACYWLTHTSTTEPYGWFTRRRDLKRFVAVFKDVIPDSRWYIEIVPTESQSEKEALGAWRLRKSLTAVVKAVNRPPPKSVARLHFRHPQDKTLITQLMSAMKRPKTDTRRWVVKKYSAHTLQFVLHMLAIMIFGEEELIAGLAACRDAGTGWK